MIEIRAKRAIFISSVLTRLKLQATAIANASAQTCLDGRLRKPDVILSRAFLPWQKLQKLAAPHLTDGGILLVLASEPPFQSDIWQEAASQSYTVAGRQRWFWAMRLKKPF